MMISIAKYCNKHKTSQILYKITINQLYAILSNAKRQNRPFALQCCLLKLNSTGFPSKYITNLSFGVTIAKLRPLIKYKR